MKCRIIVLQALCVTLLLSSSAFARTHRADRTRPPGPAKPYPVALVYKGKGACSLEDDDAGESGYGCSDATAVLARAAGFRVRFIGPTDIDKNTTRARINFIFAGAKLWIQPGGFAVDAYDAMTNEMHQAIKDFVAGGGGYVGFCAGAMIATAEIGESGEEGLGIFPGKSATYGYTPAKKDVQYAFLPVDWKGNRRKIYFEGGPYLYDQDEDVEIIGRFATGETAAARTQYGNGRVYITGPHVEAPKIWSQEDGVRDPDGSAMKLGIEMLRWAARTYH